MVRRATFFRLISLLLTVALLIFAYVYIKDIASNVALAGLTINWLLVACSVLFFIVFYGLLSLHWLLACRVVKKDTGNNQYLAFFASQPYKYLPTSLFTFSYRAVFAKRLGLGLKKSSLAQLLENLSMFLSNLIIFTVLYSLSKSVMAGLIVLAFLLAVAWLSLRCHEVTISLKGKKVKLVARNFMTLLAVSMAAWLAAGIAFILANASLGAELPVLKLMAANTLAFSLGLLAFFAPGGIGIRELVYGYFSVGVAPILMWRILTFILDFAFGIMAIRLISFRQPKRV